MVQGIVQKRSVRVSGHHTSITLEEPFWVALRGIADERELSLNQLISEIDAQREGNLSSALRVYILRYFQGNFQA